MWLGSWLTHLAYTAKTRQNWSACLCPEKSLSIGMRLPNSEKLAIVGGDKHQGWEKLSFSENYKNVLAHLLFVQSLPS